MNANHKKHWVIALRGMQRFFDEGMVLWPKEKFYLLFPNEKVAKSSYVLSQLKELEKNGAICLVGTDEIYIKILKI